VVYIERTLVDTDLACDATVHIPVNAKTGLAERLQIGSDTCFLCHLDTS